MRTATTLLAALSLVACGADDELELASQGISQDMVDAPETSIPQTTLDAGSIIVTVDGVPRLDGPGFPGSSIDPDSRASDEDSAREESGTASRTTMDQVFDPTGYCRPVQAERACPTPEIAFEIDPNEYDQKLFDELMQACESWVKRGPASYAMDMTEVRIIPEIEHSRERIEATVCAGATVEALEVSTGDELDPTTVASIDNLFWAAADHIVKGDDIRITIDPNLSYISNLTVVIGAEQDYEPEIFETSAYLRPIEPSYISID
jgi:hypothetical protein